MLPPTLCTTLLFGPTKPLPYVVCAQLPPVPLLCTRLGLLLGDSGMTGHTQGAQVVHVTAATSLVHSNDVVSMPCIPLSSLKGERE